MNLEHWCWLALVACALHIVEEFLLDWCGWVKNLTGIEVSLRVFWTMNLLVLSLGVICASAANRWPAVALAIPALMLINATVFHVGGWIWMRGRFSPGLLTAILLFYPIAFGCYWSANKAGTLTAETWTASLFLGALPMSVPILLLRTIFRKKLTP